MGERSPGEEAEVPHCSQEGSWLWRWEALLRTLRTSGSAAKTRPDTWREVKDKERPSFRSPWAPTISFVANRGREVRNASETPSVQPHSRAGRPRSSQEPVDVPPSGVGSTGDALSQDTLSVGHRSAVLDRGRPPGPVRLRTPREVSLAWTQRGASWDLGPPDSNMSAASSPSWFYFTQLRGTAKTRASSL